MRVRPWLFGLLMISTVCAGVGCRMFGAKTDSAAASRTLAPPLQPVMAKARSQKSETANGASLPPVTLADGEVAVRTVAYVNNTPIFESELREMIMFRLREAADLPEPQRSQKLNEIRAAELEKLIEREVCMEAANTRMKKLPPKVMDELNREAAKECDRRIKDVKEQMKFKSDEELKQFFVQQGISMSNFRRNVERSFIAMEFMRNLIFPKLQHIPPSEIQEYYRANAEEFAVKDRLKWQDIFLDASKFPDREAARRYAGELAAHLKSGADFAKTAKDLQKAGFNILPGEQGLGEKPGEIRPTELEPILLTLSTGQVGGPVELPGGFHLVKVSDRSYPGRKPLDADTQNEIRSKLRNLLAEKEYRRMVDDLKSKAVIQRMP
jgi:parvulin-like peptidyl-prolyl isomerase